MDPGFPRVASTRKAGTPTYYLAKISWKLHENEEKLTGGARPEFDCVDLPLIAMKWIEFGSL